MIFFLVALVLTGLMVWGLLISQKERDIDRRHYAAFVGFIAGIIAILGVTLNAAVVDLQGHTSPYDTGPVQLAFNLIMSIVIFASIPTTFFAGMFSGGFRRIALISCSLAVSLMLLLTIAGHFGD